MHEQSLLGHRDTFTWVFTSSSTLPAIYAFFITAMVALVGSVLTLVVIVLVLM